MNEDFATPAWADRHAQFSDGIGNAIRAVADGLKVLNARQFDAPWRRPVPPQDCTAH